MQACGTIYRSAEITAGQITGRRSAGGNQVCLLVEEAKVLKGSKNILGKQTPYIINLVDWMRMPASLGRSIFGVKANSQRENQTITK